MNYADNIPEDNDSSDDGEVIKNLKDFNAENLQIISDLNKLERTLQDILLQLESGKNINQQIIARKIEQTKESIVKIKEAEESQVKQLKVAINLLNKIRAWVEEMA